MIAKFIDRTVTLAFEYPQFVKVYPPSPEKSITAILNLVNNKLADDLTILYRLSNGLTLLDYCLVGCSNKKIINFRECNEGLWLNYPELRNKFYAFIVTSSGDYFGYINFSKQKPIVGYLNINLDARPSIICSSIDKFLSVLIDEIEKTIKEHGPSSYYIKLENWPRDLDYWYYKDNELKKMYEEGDLPYFFNS